MIVRLTVGIILGGFLLGAVYAAEQEVAISAAEFQKLDTFEAHELAKADQAFAAKEYRQAGAAYEAFLTQYPKSVATAYVLLRKARCLHLDNKRFEAIKAYNEVLDYFPNAVDYAGAALYYIGTSQWENGNVEPAMKAWAEMAQDADYRRHFLAAGAIAGLADNLVKQKKPAEAAGYYQQVAVDFRQANPDTARYAIQQAVLHYVRVAPDEPKLRAFYDKVGTFEYHPRPPDETNYWFRVRETIHRLGTFEPAEKDAREKYYRYWAGVMEGKHPDWDDFQVDWAEFRRAYEGDAVKWAERLDQQFQKYQKPGDYSRVVRWIQVYRESKPKVQEYYGKLEFAKMTNRQVQDLMRILYDDVRDAAMAGNVFAKLRLDQLTDNERFDLERYLWFKDQGQVETVCQSFGDKDRGRIELLRCYQYHRNAKAGLPLADEMTKLPATAKEAFWIKAELLQYQGKFPESIAAYQLADNPPQNLWRIVDCYQGLRQRDRALGQLREIENFFQDQAPEAALRIAYLYRDAGEKKQYIASLRGVLKKYPKSGQSSAAHRELEQLGVKIGGGVDAE